MALSDISLTAGMRNNLVSLQSTTALLTRTQTRLSTGKKVNNALDNPTSFFTAQNHTQRANSLLNRKDAMGEAIQTVNAANDGITSITALIAAAKGLGQSARSADNTGRNTLSTQFNAMLTQITALATDSNYKGKNFLKSDSLQVLFNENGSASMNIQGFSATASGLGIAAVTVGTNDTTTAGMSGGTGTTVYSTAVHTAVLNTALNPLNFYSGQTSNIETLTGSYSSLQLTAATVVTIDMTAGSVLGFTGVTSVSGLNTQLGYSTVMSNNTGTQITNVRINGQLTAGGTGVSWNVTGVAGTNQFQINFVTGIATLGANSTATSFSVTYDVLVRTHTQNSSGAAISNLTVYDMAVGDSATGANLAVLAGMDATGATNVVTNGSGVSGLAVYNSGVLVNPSMYSFVGTQLVFAPSGVPSTTIGSVQYNYNAGFSTTMGVSSQASQTYTAASLNTGTTNTQTITAVYVNGSIADTSTYKLSGAGGSGNNLIIFNTGTQPAVNSQITYDVKTAGNVGAWTTDVGIDASNTLLEAATTTLQTQAAAMASNLSVINVRQDFTTALTNDLLKGADNLTLADMNEEGANMLMLQTRQQLGTTSLKMASDSASAIMRLF
jgi:flagellin-like hook-associated protein FlgL